MAIISPNTDLRLLSVPLTAGDGQQMDFATAAAQATYFQGKTVKTFADFTYQRKDQYIRVPEDAEQLYNCNYVMYRNTGHGNKWFYAFITRIEFVNQNCAHIFIETDVFQTWLFDFSFRQCLVQRETVADDTIFTHTLPENIACGESKVRSTENVLPSGASLYSETYAEFNNNYYCCIVSSSILKYISGTEVPATRFFSGSANACYYYAVPITSLYEFIDKVNTDGQIEAIISVIAVPKAFVTFHAFTDTSVTGSGYITQPANPANFAANKNISDIDGYTPKNKKLFCYPYNFMELQSGDSSTPLRYEYFTHPTYNQQFTMNFMISLSPIYGVCPVNYDGQAVNEREGVTFQDFPPIPYGYSAYKNYIALHQNSIALSLINRAAGSLRGGLSGNPLKIFSGLPEAFASQADMAKEPRRARGQLTGNWLSCIGKNSVYLHLRTIRAEYAKIVDDYFSRFGYRVDTLKTPSFKNRPAWDYVQTERCVIVGDIPESDATKLQQLFNNGITVWHDPAHFGDYSRNNAPA